MENTIAELIQRSRPLAGTSSLNPSRPISSPPKPPPPPSPPPTTSQAPTQNPKTLKTLNFPSILTGILTLPSHSATSTPKCCCFQFSDGSSAPICCDVSEFNPKVLGKQIKITSWNFIPLKCDNKGFLEIIRWDFVEPPSVIITSGFTNLDNFPLKFSSSDDQEECNDSSIKARRFVYGAVEFISPVSVVPFKGVGDSKSSNNSRNLCGFLVNMLTCECELCGCKNLTVALRDLGEVNGSSKHCFLKSVTVYFLGDASSWHPAITRLVGNVVLLSGLAVKLVSVDKEESLLVYVTKDVATLHLPVVPMRWVSRQKVDARGYGECGWYTGTVTGSYMEGMVVELDREVMLLLTDKQLSVPHSLRVGAIVSVRSVHFVNPRFSWRKILVLGACLRTSMVVESFSPLETGCHMSLQSQSLLRKYVESLSFGGRLWMLLLITSFRRMFAGIFPEKVILGYKHKEGLVQKFASSQLPPSAFQPHNGFFMDFLKHDSCGCGSYSRCGDLKLVIPISTLVSHCRERWMKMLLERDENLQDSLPCGGRTYAKPTKLVLHSEQIGVILLGVLKISSSRRLQLADSTGSIEVLIPELPSTWSASRIYKIKDFSITMEGIGGKPDLLSSLPYESLTCQSIFCSTPRLKEMNMSLHLKYNVQDQQSLNCSCPFCLNVEDSPKFLESGTYRLLRLMHKFPVLQKFQGEQVFSNKSSVFAEAIVLPWDLVLTGKDRYEHPDFLSSDQLRDFLEHLNRNEKSQPVTLKRCKVDQSPNQDAAFDSSTKMHTYSCSSVGGKCRNSNSSLEIPCKVTGRSANCSTVGVLRSTVAEAKISSPCRQCGKRTLLEFSSESFHLYQGLRIGCYYLLKHGEEDMPCQRKDHSYAAGTKILVTTGMHLWSASLSCDEGPGDANLSSVIQSCQAFVVNDDNFLNRLETCSDINLSVPANVISYIKLDHSHERGEFRRSFSVKEDLEMHNCRETRVGALLKSFEASTPLNLLPAGNLISLHGLVMAVHDCNQSPLTSHAICGSTGTRSICIHILMEDSEVKIVGPLSRGAYPTGFGQGVYANFHRVLELDRQKEYRLIPASFIEIDSTSPLSDRSGDGKYNGSLDSGSENVTSAIAVPAVLIYELLKSMELKPVQLRCRVLAVYALVLEKTGKASSCPSGLSSFNIALAGFVLDDGTSSCCCWANHDSAAALLRLHIEETPREDHTKSSQFSTQPRARQASNSTTDHLIKILQKHRSVIVRNHGSPFDYLNSDLTFSVSSGERLSSSDEDALRCLILDVCFSTLRSVVGSLMDFTAVRRLGRQLTDLGMTMPPMLNISATGVHHIDPLNEARSILQGLISS